MGNENAFQPHLLWEGCSVPGAVRALEDLEGQGFCACLGTGGGMEGLQTSQDLPERRAKVTQNTFFSFYHAC